MGFSKQRASLLLDELLSSYVCYNNLEMIRKIGSTATTVQHKIFPSFNMRIVVQIKMLKPTEAD